MAENSQLNVVIRGKDELTPQFNQLESRLIRFVGAVTSAIAAIKISALPITSAGDFERELANVKKTTNFTTTEIDKLSSGILDMSLRIDVAALDLAKIAAAAGQQGLGGEGVEGIIRFTESVARMASVLDITAEQAASDIGKILNVFQLPTTQVENVVSAFNKVTNNAPAQGRQVLDIVKRIGDAAAVSGRQISSLTNAIALAATGLELGINPEVIGTSFVKIFAQMQTKAEKFAVFLSKYSGQAWTTESWSQFVAKDGVIALKYFNDNLRKMKSLSEQAKVVSELQGQGRVYGLGTKLGRDTLDSTLNKNLNNARTGFSSGLSAIEEQRTVLNTLNAQLTILKNAFFKLATEGGTPLLGQLAAQARQVTDALQSEKVRSFVVAGTAAIGDLIGVVLKAAEAIGSLNVNWENFVQVLKVFVEVKVAQYFLAMAASALAATAATKGSFLSMINGFRAGTDAATRAALASGNPSRIAAAERLQAAEKEKGSLAALQKAYRDKQATALAASAAQVKAAQAVQNAELATNRVLAAQRAERAANAVAGAANRNTSAATTRVASATANQANTTAAGLARVAAAQQIGNTKIAAAEAAHQRQLQVIQSQFQGARTTAEKATRDGIIASENAFHTRQMAAIRAADARRVAQAEATALRLNAIASQRVTGANANLANAINRTTIVPVPGGGPTLPIGSAAATTAAAAAAASSAAATRAARIATVEAGRARQALDAARASATLASTALTGFTAVVGFLGAAFGFLMRAIFPLFLIFTILYTVLDATGSLQSVLGFFRGLTDVMGLTSEASRKLAADEKKKQDALKLTTEQVQEQIDAFRKLLDLRGKLDPDKLDTTTQTGALGATIEGEARSKILADISGQAIGAQELKKQIDENLKTLPKAQKEAKESFDAIAKEYTALQKRLADLKATPPPLPSSFGPDTAMGGMPQITGIEDDIKAAEEKLKVLADKYASASKVVLELSKDATGSLTGQAKIAADNMAQTAAQITSLFSEQSKGLFEAGVPLRKTQDEIVALQKQYSDLLGSPLLGKSQGERDKALNEIKNKIIGAQTEAGNLTKKFDELKATLIAIANLDNPAKGFVDALLGDLKRTEEILSGPQKTFENFTKIFATMDAQRKAGVPLPAFVGGSGGNVQPAPPSTGNVKSQEELTKEALNEARKLAKAKDELRRAELEADQSRQRQENDAFLREQQRLFDVGLISLQDYYERKAAIERLNLVNEIFTQKGRITSKKEELNDTALKPSDKVKIQAEITTLEAQLDVSKARLKEIPLDMANSIAKSVKDFNESVLSDKLEIARAMGLEQSGDSFDVQIALLQSQISEKLNKFRSQLAKGTPGMTQAFVDNFGVTQVLKLIDPALQLIAEKARLTAAAVQTSFTRIEIATQRGLLTDREAVRARNDARAVEAQAVAAQIVQSEKAIEQFVKTAVSQTGVTEATVRATDEYIRQEQTVDDLRVKYQELSVAVDEVARSINKTVEQSLTTTFTGLITGPDKNAMREIASLRYDLAKANTQKEKEEALAAIKAVEEQAGIGFKNKLKMFLKDLTAAITEVLAKDLAQGLVKNFLGGGGDGGIGGFFSRLLNVGGVGGKDAKLVSKDLLGRSEGTAMFVKVVGKDGKTEDKKNDIKEAADKIKGELPDDGSLRSALGNGDVEFNDFDALPDVSELKATDFSDFAAETGAAAQSAIDEFGGSIADNLDTLGDAAQSGELGLGGLFNSLSSSLSGIFGSLTEGASGLADGLSSVLGSLFETLKGLFGGGGGDALGLIGSFFHTGGVVGEGAVTRMVNPMVFAGAMRYHTGGIAGLKADEVPSILRKGEEVLTADNPRHRDNAGSAAPAAPSQVQLTVHPDALRLTLGDWLEGELARTHANR